MSRKAMKALDDELIRSEEARARERGRALRIQQRKSNKADWIAHYEHLIAVAHANIARYRLEIERVEALPVDGSPPRGGSIWSSYRGGVEARPKPSRNGHGGP